MRNLLLTAALATCSLVAGAQTFSAGTSLSGASELKARNTQNPFTIRNAQSPTVKTVAKAAKPKSINPLDYGTKVTVISEDFSLLETGEIGNPDATVKMVATEYKYPWINLKDEYFQTPGWGGFNVFPAGGVLCIDTKKDYGHINTPMLNLAAYDRVAVLTFKARTDEGATVSDFIVQGAETFNMSPTWRFLDDYVCPDITDEWQTYEFVFHDCGEYTLLNLVPNGQSRVYLDDIEVYVVDPYIAMPLTKPHTNYQGTSFDANWEAVEGAEYYLVNLYEYDALLGEYELVKEDLKAETNTLHITEVESGTTYYYTVRAVKEGHQSLESSMQAVFNLVAPVLNPVNGGEDEVESYDASWSVVPSANYYNYWAYGKRVAEADGEFIVTNEDFNNLKKSDGSDPEYTLEEHDFNVYSDTYLVGLTQAGWNGQNYIPYAEGMACVDAYHYLYNHEQSCIISPELDLSKDGGKFTLNVKLMGEVSAFWDTEGQKHEGATQCAVAIFNYDEETGEFNQAELVYPGTITDSWQDFTVQLTKGAARSKVGIFGVSYPGNLYIDDVKITQNYKAGEYLVDPFRYAFMHEGAAINVDLPNSLAGMEVYHKVSAVKMVNAPGVEGSYKESAFSDLERVNVRVSGIEQADMEGAAVKLSGNRLTVVNPHNEDVTVYNADGSRIAAANAQQTVTTLPVHGVYIVKVGNKVSKIAY